MERKIKIMQLSLVIGFLITISVVDSSLNPGGIKCGKKSCLSTEYCSPFDYQCRPCSSICNADHHNHDPSVCVENCQEYLHDQRYVLRADLGRDGNLREKVEQLSTLVKVSFSLTIFVTLVIIFLLVKTFLKLNRIREALVKIFGKKWMKNTNANKVRNDMESGGGVKSQQQNNARLIMPTISASVAPSSQSSNGSSTTNTSATTISRREAIEDNTLDFAYDNPAMTPSPNTTVQPKSKRESSF